MRGQSGTDDEAVAVTIFGRTYHLRGADDPQHLVELASVVDAKMREIADGTGTADTLKVAILASLNLADEYLRSDLDDDTPASVRAEKRLGRMVTLLDEALVE
jgi:cell division protein ZapA